MLTLFLYTCSHALLADSRQTTASDTRTYVYVCDNAYSFVARVEGAHAWLFLPGNTVQLPQVRSASGVKYSDGGVTFWLKAEEALLDLPGAKYRDCINDRRAAIWEHAKLNGVDFRAVGNEPGWYLEISNKNRISLVTDYGQSKYLFEDASINSSSAKRETRYHAAIEGHSLEIVLIGKTCQDTMADEQYETSVIINLDGTELKGCGKALH